MNQRQQKRRVPRDLQLAQLGRGVSAPQGPPYMRTPQPRATGCQQMVSGAISELTGTPREVTVGGAEGGAKDHRHTTGILLLVGTLSDKPPSSSTSPVAARKKKKQKLCWTLPIGLVCPLVPGLGPASLGLPGQHPSPDRRSLIYGGGGPQHYQTQQLPVPGEQTPPFVISLKRNAEVSTGCHGRVNFHSLGS